MQYAFVLGRNPEISIAELGSIFGNKLEIPQNRSVAFYMGKLPCDKPRDFLNKLGGCVEIIEIYKRGISVSEVQKIIEEILMKNCAAKNAPAAKTTSAKCKFAINLLPENKKSRLLGLLLPAVKKSLRLKGVPASFMNNGFENVNAVFAFKQGLADSKTNICIIDEGEGKTAVGCSAAMQDFEAYSKRDFAKPFRDPHAGMLPPKLAQVMVNLGTNNAANMTILDPFCGTGTILMEAMLMGFSVIGGDKDKHMANGTMKNLEWLRQNFNIDEKITSKVSQADASAVSLIPNPIPSSLAIATEPYLGPPLSTFPSETFFQKLVQELKDLYLGFFKNLAGGLKPGTAIVFIMPVWKKATSQIRLSDGPKDAPRLAGGANCLASPRHKPHWPASLPPMRLGLVDKIQALGYSKTVFAPLTTDSLFYDRPGQIVGREIVRFVKK